jgi:hypothetical protein
VCSPVSGKGAGDELPHARLLPRAHGPRASARAAPAVALALPRPPLQEAQEAVTLLHLSTAINQARQLTQALRGRELPAERADELAELLRAAQALARGRKPQPQKPTRRRVLWRRDPRCFWCGVVTTFATHGRPDSATVDHLYPRGHPRRSDPRKHLPPVVLSCYGCNQERGAKPATVSAVCPLLRARGRHAARLLTRRPP